MKALLLAFQFLTIIPVGVERKISSDDLSRSAGFFPAVGAFQGLLAVSASYLFRRFFGPEIVPAVALLVLAASNGGFHLDGLADTFDALAVKSSGDSASDVEKRLSVMKDANTGPIGVISIVFAILLKFLLLRGLFLGLNNRAFYACLFMMPIYSKWSMVPPMYHGVNARRDGLGKTFIEHVDPAQVVLSTGLTIVLSFVIYGTFLRGSGVLSMLALCIMLLGGLYLFGFLAAGYCLRKFGGVTGDIFGAISELSEIFFLLGASAWLLHST